MSLTRRDFLATTVAAGAAGVVRAAAQTPAAARRVFRHGVASGDPVADAVILWTRLSPPPSPPDALARLAVDVRWEIASDPAFTQIAARGSTMTTSARDFTVKVDAVGLRPGRTYYYRFVALGERSPTGRTRTLPAGSAARVRLAIASCSNLPFGYFNAYRRIAARADLDAVLHLGDYLYEYANDVYGDGRPYGREPQPAKEILTLSDYRARHAQYKADPDLQEAHRQHPFIVVWDDHEIADNTWRDGAGNHNPDLGEGEWPARRDAAVKAYFEWMPIREDRATRQPRIYRAFAFGDLADLVMLDTRVIDRDQQPDKREEVATVDDGNRSLLGRAQEQWLLRELAESKRAGTVWQLLGQQVLFAPLSTPGAPSQSVDTWEAYRPARSRLLETVGDQEVTNLVVLTGDIHSSWAYDVPRNPWDGYDPATGRGTIAVEFATPAITSPSGFATPEEAATRIETLRNERPHLRYAEGVHRGYVVLDVTRERVQADWFFVPTVSERTTRESFGGAMVSVAGKPHLTSASSPSSEAKAPDPAPGE